MNELNYILLLIKSKLNSSYQKAWEGYDFLFSYSKPFDALLYAFLFCPETIEIEGSVILKYNYSDEKTQSWFVDYKILHGSKEAERHVNFVEVPALLGSDSTLSPEVYNALAFVLQKAWCGWLSQEYLGRQFNIEVVHPETSQAAIGLTFHEVRGK